MDSLGFGRRPLAVMRSVKRALDPGNLFNPGKVIPPTAS
jgi:FAD/FMN-containing dehydrogenase